MAEKVDQDVREAAAQWSWLTDMWESPEYDAADMLAKAFARMKAAGRQQGLREAVEVAQKRVDIAPTLAPNAASAILDALPDAITALMEGEEG